MRLASARGHANGVARSPSGRADKRLVAPRCLTSARLLAGRSNKRQALVVALVRASLNLARVRHVRGVALLTVDASGVRAVALLVLRCVRQLVPERARRLRG